jgi:CelD/BcsL family acetyltransferase involved in cellulose biosynthesis
MRCWPTEGGQRDQSCLRTFVFIVTKIIVEVVEGASAIEALRIEWQGLFRAAHAPPFLSWEWMSAWQQSLNRQRTPYLLCARQAGELIGLLPLGVEELPAFGGLRQIRRLSLLGEGFGGADYLDLLAKPEAAHAAAVAIFEWLARTAEFDLLELDGLASDSPSLARLTERFETTPQLRYRCATRFVCPQVELAGDWSRLLKRSRRADNFKRRLRQIRNYGGFEYRSVTAPTEAGAAFERFLALHEPRWSAQGGSDFTGHEALRAFHRDLVQRLAQAGLLRFDELWVEGACRASIYGIDDGQRYCFYNSGYDPAWKHASPGLVLLGLSIEAALARGVKLYDFLRGDEGYKFDWATTTCATVSVLVARRRLPVAAFLLAQQTQERLRARLKTLLPEQVAATARAWYRSHKRNYGLLVKTSTGEVALD